jgi:cell wall-associated NlpC family hydrolase
MNRIGRTELTGMEHLTVDETVALISKIGAGEVQAAAKAAYSGPYVIGAVGPFGEDDLEGFVK